MAEADPPAHPMAHVSPEKRHELLLAERNLLVNAKADRENELVRALVQTASAILLLIPAFLSTKDVTIPRLLEAKALYTGLASVAISLLLALLEQHLSARAYDRQINVVFDYYTLASDQDLHSSVRLVRWVRTSALVTFFIDVISSSAGIALAV